MEKKAKKVKKKVIHVSGKRKTSIARATICEGASIVRINRRNINTLEPITQMIMKEPLILAGDLCKNLNINVDVKGGGVMSQSEASRLVIAKGILEYTGNRELRKKFLDYDKHLLIADIRRTEPQKSCKSSARRGRQTSKR